MSQIRAEVIEIWLAENGDTGIRIACQTTLQPAVGQYILANGMDFQAVPSTPLFSISYNEKEILVAPPAPPAWRVGMQLSLRGPLGEGFSMPRTARKVALAVLTSNPYRLLALVQQALAQEAVVVFFTAVIPGGLSPDVEVLPFEQLPEVLRWADYLALDFQASQISQLNHTLGLPAGRNCPCKAQALVQIDMPCGGTGNCGVCSILTRRGWRLACDDGPVFELNELLSK